MKIANLEGARGIAAILVVFYHVSNHMRHNIGYYPLGGIAQFGHAGVDFFFVLSGFIIFYVHSKDFNTPSRLIEYAQRRFTRIYPLYWFVIILTVVLELIFAKNHKPDPIIILNSITLLPTLNDPYIGVAWTLQHEIIFYVIFSVSIISYRIGLTVFTTWMLALIMSCLVGYENHGGAIINKVLSPYNIEFFLGMCAAWITLYHQKKTKPIQNYSTTIKKRKEYAKFILISGLVLFLIFGFFDNLDMFDKNSHMARWAYGLSSMLIVIGLASAGEVNNKTMSNILTELGSASFSIYLTHFIFIGIIYKILEISGFFTLFYTWLTYALLSASGIIGGIVISRYIEHPLTNLTRNYLSKTSFLTKKTKGI